MKRLASFVLAAAMALSVVGCTAAAPSESTAATPAPATTEAAETPAPEATPEAEAAAFPVTVTDQAGREVTIEAEPQRIVSGYYISTSLLIALGQTDKLVGIEAKADTRPIYSLSAPELLELPNVGSAKEFDLEGCAALEPDLVILPLKLSDAAETLSGLGIPVILINPEDQELLEETIALVGTATGSTEAADELLAFSDDQAAELESLMADVERPTVYLAGNSDLLSTAGDAMYQSDMIRLAGGENVAAELTDTYWVDVDYEQILAWDPEYIILASDASYTCEDVLNDEALAACTAVVNGNVYQIPSDAEAWDSPVPSGILGSVWLASVLHPDVMSTEDATAVMSNYYDTFYHFTYPAA